MTIAIAVLGILVLYQGACVLWFANVVSRSRRAATPCRRCEVAVVLAVRGNDPSLARTIACLLDQALPPVTIRIVVDDTLDSAWPVAVQAAKRDPDRVTVEPLAERLETCGLKNSAIIQAVSRLPASIDTIVVADADLEPHPTWLGDLVSAFDDDRVGAAFGNRWFVPSPPTWGGLVSYVWNAAAVIPMAALGMPWGGSLAIRRTVLDDAGVLSMWSHAIVEDAPLTQRLGEHGWKVKFVPSLLMPIREEISLGKSADFVKRQLLWTRLYQPGWWIVVTHALTTVAVWPAVIWMGASRWLTGSQSEAAALVAALGCYLLALVAMIVMLEGLVVRASRDRRAFGGWLTPSAVILLPAAVLLGQLVHTAMVIVAAVSDAVTWRGVTYDIGGPFVVRRRHAENLGLRRLEHV